MTEQPPEPVTSADSTPEPLTLDVPMYDVVEFSEPTGDGRYYAIDLEDE